MGITRKTIEDKLAKLKQRLEPLLDKNGYVLGSQSQQIDVRCIRSQIWLLEEILKVDDVDHESLHDDDSWGYDPVDCNLYGGE